MAPRILPPGMVQSTVFASLAPTHKAVAMGARASELAASVLPRIVSDRKTVRWLCGDNRFDPKEIARRENAV